MTSIENDYSLGYYDKSKWDAFKEAVFLARKGCRNVNGINLVSRIGISYKDVYFELNPYYINLKTGVYLTRTYDLMNGNYIEVKNLKDLVCWV